jgi:hypothetical protein
MNRFWGGLIAVIGFFWTALCGTCTLIGAAGISGSDELNVSNLGFTITNAVFTAGGLVAVVLGLRALFGKSK